MDIWTRQQPFISPEQQQTLQNSRVLVAGVGANGSVAAEAIVRIGVGTVILADPDHVETNNLNRQNYTAADIGRPKVEALQDRLRSIQPDLNLQVYPEGVTPANAEPLITACDVVIENCDDYPAKVLLSRLCQRQNKSQVHSAGGAVRGAVTVFQGDHTYETLFDLPTAGVADADLGTLDYTAHRQNVVERFGANLFDEDIVQELTADSYAQWPTMSGACDIAAHIASLQCLWLLIRQPQHLILAPRVLMFDARTLEFKFKDFASQKKVTF
ncbi:MAG: ThiF family adenylyltransferase [Thermodesulfobacteriota bacterium]|nr:ThiF family adenylyltransferase [Thermodesulfobacteriota bacterium]